MAKTYISSLRKGRKITDADGNVVQNDWEAYEAKVDHLKPQEGELVLEYDNSIPRLKIGDGVHEFSELPYMSVDSFILPKQEFVHLSTQWDIASDDRYFQEVKVNNAVVTSKSKIDLQPTSEQLSIFHEKDLTFVTENEDGIIRVYCVGKVPQNPYDIPVTITEVVTGDTKIIGNTTATPNPCPDWNQTDEIKADYIKNKPDIDNIINQKVNDLQSQIDISFQIFAQSGVTYKADSTDTYSERVTAEGLNIVDGHKSVLKKVVGNTIFDKNSKSLKSATFGGIETTNKDETKVSIFNFPKTVMPIGTTLDFEAQQITNTYAEYTFDNPATIWTRASATAINGNFSLFYLDGQVMVNLKSDFGKGETVGYARGVCDRYPAVYSLAEYNALTPEDGIHIRFGQPNAGNMYIIIPNNIKEGEITSADVREYTKDMTIRYPTLSTNTEWYTTIPFTEEQKQAGNKIIAYTQGTEKVLGNDGADFGVENTLTQNYLCMTEVEL